MTPTDTEAINAVLRATKTLRQCEDVKWKCIVDGRDDMVVYAESAIEEADIRLVKAVRLWMDAGSPMITVPDKEARQASTPDLERTCKTCGNWAPCANKPLGLCGYTQGLTQAQDHACADDHWTPREGQRGEQ